YNTIEPTVAFELMGHETSQMLWNAINDLFGVKTRSNVIFYKREFAKMQKGTMSMEDYIKTMKGLADNLALAGLPVTLDDLVTQTLAGLDSQDYNPLVCQITEKETKSWIELQSKLLSYERRLNQLKSGMENINIGSPSAHFTRSQNNQRNYGSQ